MASATHLTTRPAHGSYTAWRDLWTDTLANLRPFRTSGALRGEATSYVISTGYLPREHVHALYGAVQANSLLYVVSSYATPIAWAVRFGADGVEWIQPPVKYSVTTTRHQSVVSSAIARVLAATVTL